MNVTARSTLLAAGVLGLLGVALGAFGAHGLRATLQVNGQLDSWRTAVLYQLLHAVALLALAGWRDAHGGHFGKVVWCWVVGIVFFSGSLYCLALGGPINLLWPITPLGGLSLLTGWALLIWQAWKQSAA